MKKQSKLILPPRYVCSLNKILSFTNDIIITLIIMYLFVTPHYEAKVFNLGVPFLATIPF